MEIFKLGTKYWLDVYRSLSKENILSYGDLDFIRSIATHISKASLPTSAQCKRLMKIVNKAEEKGFIMP